jgi:deoxyribonuclease V
MTVNWTWTPDELEAFQRELAARWLDEPRWHPPLDRLLAVGGVFVASARGNEGLGSAGDRAWAAAVLIEGGRLVDSSVVRGYLDAPYSPGLLAMREGRLLAEVIAQLRQVPDVILANATGRDHPRGAGLALHLGASVGVPTVGVTDRPLLAVGQQPGPEAGAIAELRLGDELVGYRVRTREGARPIIAHAGWRTNPPIACSLVLELCDTSRTPVPLREARRLARTARARDAAE